MIHPVRYELLAGFLVIGIGCASPDSTGKKSGEEEIWALEQAYFEYNRDARYEKIASTWHDQFLGWPGPESQPIDKEEGTRYIRRNFKKPGSFTFEIEPLGIRILEDVAVNHYRITFTEKDGQGEETKKALRITHTWLREGGQWKVLGGMSNSE